MMQVYTQGKLTWVDAENPTNEEVRELIETYNIPPTLASDIGGPVPQSAESSCSGKVFKLILEFPIVRRTDINHPHEVKFIVTKDALITVRYEDIDAIHAFQKEFEVAETLKKPARGRSGVHVFYALLTKMYENLGTKLEYLDSSITDIQETIAQEKGLERQTIMRISEVSKRLISFRHTTKAHEDALTQSTDHLATCFSKQTAAGITSITTQYQSLMNRTNVIFETLEELREMNFALLTTKQNEVMKILTIMAFITFPLSLFTSMFGMNTVDTPILGAHNDFWIIVAMMSLITSGFFIFFKFKKWI